VNATAMRHPRRPARKGVPTFRSGAGGARSPGRLSKLPGGTRTLAAALVAALLAVVPAAAQYGLPVFEFAYKTWFAPLSVPPYIIVDNSLQVIGTDGPWTIARATFSVTNKSGRDVRLQQSWFNLYGLPVHRTPDLTLVPQLTFQHTTDRKILSGAAAQDTTTSRYAIDASSNARADVLASGQLLDSVPWFQMGRETSGELVFRVKSDTYASLRFQTYVAVSTVDVCKNWTHGGRGELVGQAYFDQNTPRGRDRAWLPGFIVDHAVFGYGSTPCSVQRDIREAWGDDTGPVGGWIDQGGQYATAAADVLDRSASLYQPRLVGSPLVSSAATDRVMNAAIDAPYQQMNQSTGNLFCAIDRLQRILDTEAAVNDALDGANGGAADQPAALMDFNVKGDESGSGVQTWPCPHRTIRFPTAPPPSAPCAQPDASAVDTRTMLKRLDDTTANLVAVYASYRAASNLTPEVLQATSQDIRRCVAELDRVREDLDESWTTYWKQTNDQAYASAGLNLSSSVSEVPLLS
jgi:hypothetical protein